MYERFTDELKQSMRCANALAAAQGHEYISPLHVIAGLLDCSPEIRTALDGASVDVSKLRTLAVEMSVQFPDRQLGLKQIISDMIADALSMKCNTIGPLHLMSAIFASPIDSVAALAKSIN